ncbi:hypothetical protein [Paenibacillus sp. SSG-1]|uniref:hypothetical protein n=1 Tax=Paenibacillus sp. SSG-1 TaxID=1443669 RepID=UPI00117C69CF|nr:hypothetical protein [Paenibacillus sp. SSG-1]
MLPTAVAREFPGMDDEEEIRSQRRPLPLLQHESGRSAEIGEVEVAMPAALRHLIMAGRASLRSCEGRRSGARTSGGISPTPTSLIHAIAPKPSCKPAARPAHASGRCRFSSMNPASSAGIGEVEVAMPAALRESIGFEAYEGEPTGAQLP